MAERAAARGVLSGRDVDVWQGSYLDVQTFNGRCVTYREETPHSLMLDAASNSHLACPSFYRGVIKYGEIRTASPSLRRPPRALPATGLPDLRLVGSSVLGNFLHLVITCLRRNNRSKKMSLLSSVLTSVQHSPTCSFQIQLIVAENNYSSLLFGKRADCLILHFVTRKTSCLNFPSCNSSETILLIFKYFSRQEFQLEICYRGTKLRKFS